MVARLLSLYLFQVMVLRTVFCAVVGVAVSVTLCVLAMCIPLIRLMGGCFRFRGDESFRPRNGKRLSQSQKLQTQQ